MDSIGHKIYQLGGTLEFFVSGNKVEMERYSVIHMNPEILETLDQLLAEIKVKSNRKEPFALSYKWREQERKRYILQFPVCLSAIEGICMCDYDRAYYDYQEILEYSGYNQNDYSMHLVPENFYQNMKIIEWFLGTVFDEVMLYHVTTRLLREELGEFRIDNLETVFLTENPMTTLCKKHDIIFKREEGIAVYYRGKRVLFDKPMEARLRNRLDRVNDSCVNGFLFSERRDDSYTGLTGMPEIFEH